MKVNRGSQNETPQLELQIEEIKVTKKEEQFNYIENPSAQKKVKQSVAAPLADELTLKPTS